MEVCAGDGHCISQCFRAGCETMTHMTDGGGRGGSVTHVYCNQGCPWQCRLQPCHNSPICGRSCPAWLLAVNDGLCAGCAVIFGRLRFIESGVCEVCTGVSADTKGATCKQEMLALPCGMHTVCSPCWIRHARKAGQTYPITCPCTRTSR
jgi:hypothetical protein